MKFGAIIIGDEILCGKRQDKHMPKLIEMMSARGLELAWCQYLGDDPELITATLERTFGSGDVVFSFGGIGATPDDHTRACAARAAGVELRLHPDAETEIRARFGADITPRRLMMGEFPVGLRNHSEPVQQDSRVQPEGPLLRAGIPADGMADDRVGARPPVRRIFPGPARSPNDRSSCEEAAKACSST